ncbi:MAG: AMP-binding protein [Bacteroidales bacterium]|nr:AMP-binding protein [Bacteroidales bacterium]
MTNELAIPLPGFGSGFPDNLPQLLTAAAKQFPSNGVGFVNASRDVDFITFPELESRALSFLSGMQSGGLKKGDLVILSLEKSEEIIPVLWGCFIGGIIPALLQPPVTFTEYNPAAEKTEKVFQLLKHPHVILSHAHVGNWRSSHISSNLLIDVATLHGDPDKAVRVRLNASDLALIQFSSGSTGDPKGIMLTHRNIIINTLDIITGIALGPRDVSVNWMPLYHDMGLIGFHITPVFVGVTQYFIDPVDFVKNPSIWLDVMSRQKCTITACPNFGQLLVTRYLNRRTAQDWDLSSVRILFNGAEPISVATMRIFLYKLQSFNLNPVAMFPAYGLAEATLAVTFPDRLAEAVVTAFRREELIGEGQAVEAAEGDKNIMELVNLGRSLDHCEVMVADDQHQPVRNGMVGNVLVKGDNLTAGYYGSPEVTAGVFTGKWLMTGDLGFICNGDLYITGRSKDIIFINGINYYAHDLEAIALKLDQVATGKIVITGYFDESEGRDKLLVFLVGTDNNATRELCLQIRNHFSSLIGLNTETFIPVRSGDIPRTSSGKIQRYKMVERYLKGEFTNIIHL